MLRFSLARARNSPGVGLSSVRRHQAFTDVSCPLAHAAELKQQADANLLKFGTGSFSVTLMQHGLIDELHLWRFPVIAGTADSTFDGLPLTHLQLLDTTTFGSGIVVQIPGPKSA